MGKRKKILPHWHKEKRSKKERRQIYQKLRKLGLTSYQAQRIRDWSDGHIELFLKSNGFLTDGDENGESHQND